MLDHCSYQPVKMSEEGSTSKGDVALDRPPMLVVILLVGVKTEAGEVPISKMMGSAAGNLEIEKHKEEGKRKGGKNAIKKVYTDWHHKVLLWRRWSTIAVRTRHTKVLCESCVIGQFGGQLASGQVLLRLQGTTTAQGS